PAPRAPPPFPTRRSSDLACRETRRGRASFVRASQGTPPFSGHATRSAMSIGRLHVLTDFHFQQRLTHAQLARLAAAAGADTIQLDRKSTRLNSSHVKISY